MEQRLETLEHAVQRLTEANLWRKLLDPHVPPGRPIAVLADRAVLPFEALGRPIVGALPDPAGSAAGVARLEAQRMLGVRFVVVPEAARSAVEQDARLTEHLRAHFRVIAEDPATGAVLEASAHTLGEAEMPAPAALIESLRLADPLAPMLDWTSLGMALFLPGRTLFQPVEPDAEALPYLDHTIEVVLVDSPERMDEAARVAADTAVLVTADGSGGAIAAETRRMRSGRSPAAAASLIVVMTDADDGWFGEFTEAVAGRPGVEVRAAVDLAAAVETDASRKTAATIVLAERGVLPLPQCIEAAERLLAADQQVGGVAVKMFEADGSLEAAGGAAFADGSVEGIAKGAPAAAQWHEYVRPVAAAVGLVVLRSAAARECARPGDAGPLDLAAVSARLWSSGWELRYQPDAAAVRVLPPVPARSRIWPEAPRGLPARPDEFDDASWRRLLARDELGAVR